jgi:phospholipase C
MDQRLPTQARGVRPSRALPYELHVSAQARRRDGAFELLFRNTGAAGAVFHVYDRLHLDRIPRRYTVEAGKRLRDAWNVSTDLSAYDLWILGPNGFHRHFRGKVPVSSDLAHPEIEVRYDIAGRAVQLLMKNNGKAACELTVRANAYRSDGPWRFQLHGGGRAKTGWSVVDSSHWYDFTVTAPDFERRFAGRMETGEAGSSDPAMGAVENLIPM